MKEELEQRVSRADRGRQTNIEPVFPTRTAFRAWLKAMPRDRMLAKNWHCDSCPLAQFLSETFGGEWYVSPSLSDDLGKGGDPIYRRARKVSSDETLPILPEWANDFAHRIDKLGKKRLGKDEFGFGEVTARDCLNVLRRGKSQ